MRFATKICRLTAATAALAGLAPSAYGDATVVGGYAGATLTTISTSYDCPDDAGAGCSTLRLAGLGRGDAFGR